MGVPVRRLHDRLVHDGLPVRVVGSSFPGSPIWPQPRPYFERNLGNENER